MQVESADPYLMLTPAGALLAFAERAPKPLDVELQTLMLSSSAVRRSTWLAEQAQRAALLDEGLRRGWLHEIRRKLLAPNVALDNYLPHAIAGLSGSRMAALASDDGFCLARVGYTQDEADTLCVAAADFLGFVARQKQRGFTGTGSAISFHESIDMLMPTTTFALFWVDGAGYWLILDGEPLLNNRALVELIWGICVAGEKFLA